MSSSDKKPRFITNQEGLDISKSLADAMGIPFDYEEVRKASNDLHQNYYNKISTILGPTSTGGVKFDAGAMRLVNAFAEPIDKDSQSIYFDEQLDFWLFTCAHLMVVAACKALEDPGYRNLISLFINTLNVPLNPYLHEKNRLPFKKFLLEYHDCVELSHALSRSMIVFTVCHELAHIKHGHISMSETPNHEIEADTLAAFFFGKIIDAEYDAGDIYVHRKLAGSPILLMHFFDLLERNRFKNTGRYSKRITHPHPIERSKNLSVALSSYLDDDANYLLNGCLLSLEDIAVMGGLIETPDTPVANITKK